MNQIERIEQMEQLYNHLREQLNQIRTSFEQFQKLQEDVKLLSDYYASEQWRQDYDDDTAGKLPADLKRGVLSQDAIYLLLEDYDELSNAFIKP